MKLLEASGWPLPLRLADSAKCNNCILEITPNYNELSAALGLE